MTSPTYRKQRKPRQQGNRITLWILLLVLLALAALGWRVWVGMHTVEPVFYSLLVSVNGQPHGLLSGEKLTIHPKDRLRILKISTNVPFNIGIRLYCPVLDAQALAYDEYRLIDLVPEQVAFTSPTLNIEVKYYNQDAGQVTFLVRPSVEDWLEKAARIIDVKKRIEVLEEALQKVPGSEEIRKRLLDEYIRTGQFKKAAVLLEQEVAGKASREGLDQLLDLYKKAGDTKGVIYTLQRLIELDPGDKASRYALAELLEKRGELTKAIAQYKVLLHLAPPDERFDLYVQLGYLSVKAGKMKEAIRYYKEATSLNRKDANLYYNLAYLYEKLGERKKADYYLEKAVGLKTSDIEGRIKLAERWLDEGRYKKAIPLLEQVLKRRPKSIKALLLLMKAAEKTGDKPRLRDTYRCILRLRPKDTTILYNLGALEYEDGRLGSASSYLEKYVALKPKDKTAHALLFDIYKQRNKTAKALEQAEKLISLGTHDLDLYAYIFELLKKNKDYRRLEAVMKTAVKKNPRNVQLRKFLVFALLQNNEEQQAMVQMEQILKLEPKNKELWLHLAKLKEKNKKYGEAMAAYKRVIELDPDNEEAADAYLKLRLQGFEEKTTE